MSPSYQNVEMSAIFVDLIINCYTQKCLFIGIKNVMVTGKGQITAGKL